MTKLFNFLESLYLSFYLLVVVLLRLFRLISQERFCELLFGKNDPDFSKEDVSFSNIFRKK